MSESEVKEVRASIGGGREIVFKSVEDCLLFSAFMGSFPHFKRAYEQLKPGESVTPRIYRRYCAPGRHGEFVVMTQTTKLSDGSLLADSLESLRKS